MITRARVFMFPSKRCGGDGRFPPFFYKARSLYLQCSKYVNIAIIMNNMIKESEIINDPPQGWYSHLTGIKLIAAYPNLHLNPVRCK